MTGKRIIQRTQPKKPVHELTIKELRMELRSEAEWHDEEGRLALLLLRAAFELEVVE